MPWPEQRWGELLRAAVVDLDDLLGRLDLRAADLDVDTDPTFPLRVPEPFVARMARGDPADPLLRQVLPLREEHRVLSGYQLDPLEERSFARAPGLVQKYQGRALLMAAPACAVHCRYCFRRHFPYTEHRQHSSFPGLQQVADDPGISELILSGGDPLMLKDAVLSRLIAGIDAVPHVTRLRIHSRLPVVIPQRVTSALIERLRASRATPVMVLHVNHANEIDADFRTATLALRDAGIVVLNQSVLLAGVNDSVAALAALSERLFHAGALPYYLHLPDQVLGTHHFAVSEARARALVTELRARLPGYLLPRLAREVPGAPAKQVLM